ncbi:LacI family DNA-binding transcriptional regulator [Paenibacillus sp. BC26]|uniref:LacI family DNA-binding transcriptional regulator n=1 Tax=Paenibacillus sp. BC26 TaxID=1881032 RepID=UPI0008ED3DBE|nr:LacI family DNA-binding transcriptional regulator [Paenibacillus sp. BC26]SFS52100.1 transcriptional regulator, LacI family [Paenibacillus sp. BC26]
MPTLKDIAERVGVSISTVSRAISDDTSRPVSEETKRKIRSVAVELGYKLADSDQPGAQSSTPLKQVVCIIPQSLMGDHPYFSQVLEGFHRKMNELGQPPVIVRTVEELKDMQRLAAMLGEASVKGVLAVSWYDEEFFEMMQKEGIVLLGVSFNDESLSVPVVDCDRVAAARMVIRHLVEQGHTRIGYIGGPAFYRKMENDERYIGYQFSMLQSNLTINPDWVIDTNWNVNDSYTRMTQMLLRVPKSDWPTAIFCASDMLAIPAMRAALEKDCRVPEDIAFVGMDNIAFAQYTSPPLSSIDVPKYEIGSIAAKAMVDYLDGHYSIPPKILLPCSLIVRASSDYHRSAN